MSLKATTWPCVRLAPAIVGSLATLVTSGAVYGQTFDSGSSGADGAFDLTGTPTGTIIDFNPKSLRVNKNPSGPFIDPEGDNVFHFTTITIPSGVTVKMSAKWTNGAVYWLASGAVNVLGTVELNGENGHELTQTTATRKPSVPGPGGFPGGLGGNNHSQSRGRAQPGAGPNAGAAAADACVNGCYWGLGAAQGRTNFLVPLVGGSGGGGGNRESFDVWGSGGGAGGGALLIASSTLVNVNSGAQILANGGNGGPGNGGCCRSNHGGAGAGGSVRIVAPVIQGSGTILVAGGTRLNCCTDSSGGAAGRIRLEAFQHAWTFNLVHPYTTGSPLSSFAPTTPPPFIQVTGIAGQAVRADPTGAFDTADVTVNSDDPVELTIQARYVPVGTVPKVTLFSLEGNDQQLDASPLAGTLEQSTSTATVTLPPGFSRGYVRAVWTPAS
jgi:hypothetical protein